MPFDRAGFFEADLMAMVPRTPDGISRSVWGGESKILKGCIFLSFYRSPLPRLWVGSGWAWVADGREW